MIEAARSVRRLGDMQIALESLRARTADLVAGQAELAMAGTLAAHCERIAALDARVAEADAALGEAVKMAESECAKTGRVPQLETRTRFTCALRTPTRSYFRCVGRQG